MISAVGIAYVFNSDDPLRTWLTGCRTKTRPKTLCSNQGPGPPKRERRPGLEAAPKNVITSTYRRGRPPIRQGKFDLLDDLRFWRAEERRT